MSYDKIVDSSALDASLTAVADAIRERTGKTAAMTLAEMPTEIEGISGGGDTSIEDGIIDRTISGEYTNSRATKVGNYAFYWCTKLATVSFSKATSIGDYAFQQCSNLAAADFQSVTVIGKYVFAYCTKLATVSFSKATSIGNYAFNGCSALTALVLRNTSKVCSLGNTNAFNNTPIKSGTGYIYVPDALVDSYKAATNWSTYAAQIKPLSEYTGG